jgi:hypothetical protein
MNHFTGIGQPRRTNCNHYLKNISSGTELAPFYLKPGMDHKKDLEEMNRSALERFDAYAKQKEHLADEHKKKLHDAKDKWQAAWAELMETLLVLERIEI